MPNAIDGKLFKAAKYVDQSLALVGKEFRPNIPTEHGNKRAYKCDIAILSGPDEGTYYENVLLFQKYLVEALLAVENQADGTVIGTLEKQDTGYTGTGEKGHKLVMAPPTSLELRLASKLGL